ncbi:MAG: suppressor of fused domain protein [Lachnospiraceae bacterium]|nr:suppressor of fused domain protein [Lachnospiraceae bacterium]
MNDSNILLESWSPVCNIQAVVEETDKNCYLYLWFFPGSDNAFMKSCWICNTAKAPKELDVEGMKAGITPSMPEEYVLHDLNGIRLDKENLQLIWFEEGDAAALMQGEELVCVIPGWAGYKGFMGYSAYAKGTTPLAWELTGALALLTERVMRSKDYWASFDLDGEYWNVAQRQHISALTNFFGAYTKYYAIDNGEFPPKALITGEKNDVCYAFTAGVSLLTMPTVEQYYYDQPNDFRRIELAYAVIKKYEGSIQPLLSYISAITNIPWSEVTFLGHGHTIPFQKITGYSAVWLLNARLLENADAPEYEMVHGEPVNLLWLVPLRDEEYQWIMEHSSEEALERCRKPHNKLIVFDGEGIF